MGCQSQELQFAAVHVHVCKSHNIEFLRGEICHGLVIVKDCGTGRRDDIVCNLGARRVHKIAPTVMPMAPESVSQASKSDRTVLYTNRHFSDYRLYRTVGRRSFPATNNERTCMVRYVLYVTVDTSESKKYDGPKISIYQMHTISLVAWITFSNPWLCCYP